jgi:hypothetical protein
MLLLLCVAVRGYEYNYKSNGMGMTSSSPAKVDSNGAPSYSQIKGGQSKFQSAQFMQSLLAQSLQGDQQNGVNDQSAQMQLALQQQNMAMSTLRQQQPNGANNMRNFMMGNHDAPISQVNAAIEWMKKHHAPPPDPPPPAPPSMTAPPSTIDELPNTPLPPASKLPSTVGEMTNAPKTTTTMSQKLTLSQTPLTPPPTDMESSSSNSNTYSPRSTTTSSSISNNVVSRNIDDYKPAIAIIKSMEKDIAPPLKQNLRPTNLDRPVKDLYLQKLQEKLKDAIAIRVPTIDLSKKGTRT